MTERGRRLHGVPPKLPLTRPLVRSAWSRQCSPRLDSASNPAGASRGL